MKVKIPIGKVDDGDEVKVQKHVTHCVDDTLYPIFKGGDAWVFRSDIHWSTTEWNNLSDAAKDTATNIICEVP